MLFFLCIRIVFAYGIGRLGKERKIGFGWAFTLSFFWLLMGLIVVLCSKKKDDVSFVDASSQEDMGVNNKEN